MYPHHRRPNDAGEHGLGIGRGDDKRAAGAQQLAASGDEGARFMHVLDQVGGDDRIEAARLEPDVLDSPFDDPEAERSRVLGCRTRELHARRIPATFARLGHQQTVAAPNIEQPSRCDARAEQVEQAMGRSTATALLIEVVLVLGIGVTRGHVIRRRQLVRLDGPARQAGVQVSMDSHLVARRRQFACGGPPVLPRVAQLGRAAAQAAAMRRRLLARCCHSHRHQTRDCSVRPRGIRDRRGSSAARRAAAPAAPNRDRAWPG